MNEREREHAPYHERRLEQQQLDALLRIEEQLFAIGKALTARTVITAETPAQSIVQQQRAGTMEEGPVFTDKPKGKRK
jgi:hypothetical protein